MSIIKTASLLLAASIISQVIGAVLLRPRTDNISWVPGLWYPWDTSWISKFSALGDSYAAGLGAGHAMSEGDQVTSQQAHNFEAPLTRKSSIFSCTTAASSQVTATNTATGK